jgi:bifunctional DNase/RNase
MRRNILKILFVLLLIPFSLSGKSEEKQNKPEPEEEEMIIKGVGFDQDAQSPVVILSDKKQEKVLPIWIGLCEARAIGLGLSGDVTPRPFTYDLVAAIIRTMKAKVERIIIVDLRDQVFYAQVEISVNGMVSKIDARPSDALALASRMGAPIFVKKSVLEKAPTVGGEEKEKRGT